MSRVRRIWQPGQAAQGTVEFAFVVPLFVLLLVGVVEFGWALYTQNTLGHAAQEGVRRGIVLTYVGGWDADGNRTGTYPGLAPCNTSTIVGTVACRIGAVNVTRTTARIATPDTSTPPVAAGTVEVRLDHQYRPLILGFFPGLDGIVMTGHAEMHVQ
jgi:Flp pilus assembly protein TadG